MDDDDYSQIKKKPLKLNDSKAGTTKKTKHRKANKARTAPSGSDEAPVDSKADTNRVIVTTATKAEQSFKVKQERIAEARILKKASKTHKQRVEEFNKHLDSLSEHYDIPKVSWTK